MILGQSAGTAAALAIDGGVALQDLDYGKLKARLEADRQLLDYVAMPKPVSNFTAIDSLKGIVVDDTQAELTGEWTRSSLGVGIHEGYQHDGNQGNGEAVARFAVELPMAGEYEVQVAYSTNPNRATKVPVKVSHAGGEDEVKVNQRQAPKVEKMFTSIGTFRFEKSGAVTISNHDTDGFVIIDAVRWLPVVN